MTSCFSICREKILGGRNVREVGTICGIVDELVGSFVGLIIGRERSNGRGRTGEVVRCQLMEHHLERNGIGGYDNICDDKDGKRVTSNR